MTCRKALLINAHPSVSQNSTLPAELEATKNFLCSPSGGAWDLDEIIELHQPCIKELCSVVQDLNADYTITYFCGKGFPDKHGNHFLILKDNDFIQDTELLNASLKQVVIIDDACGNIATGNFNISDSQSDLMKARVMYDRWIESCEDGQLIMHATEASTVSRPAGKAGLFTKKLLLIASTIPAAIDRFNLKSILAAGHATPDLLLDEGFEDGPAITWSKGNVKLPFAMALPLPIAMLPSLTNKGFNTGFSLGLLLFVLLSGLE